MIARNYCTKHGELDLDKIIIKDGVPKCSECGMPLMYGNHKEEGKMEKKEEKKEEKVEEKRTRFKKVSDEQIKKILELAKEKKGSEIAKELGIPYHLVSGIIREYGKGSLK